MIVIPPVELDSSIRAAARATAVQATELNKALTELQELLKEMPTDQQPPRHKLVEMIGRFTENVAIVYMVCSILEKSLPSGDEASE